MVRLLTEIKQVEGRQEEEEEEEEEGRGEGGKDGIGTGGREEDKTKLLLASLLHTSTDQQNLTLQKVTPANFTDRHTD
jgi:hypothetical protein